MCAKRHSDSWWEDRSTGQKIVVGFFIGLLILGGIALLGLVVKGLWNALMPEIFGLTEITYWQAWGLMLLSSILFKNFGSDKSSRKERKRKKELRRYMSDESENVSPAAEEPPTPAAGDPADGSEGRTDQDSDPEEGVTP